MLLAIDIGNTDIVFGVYIDQKWMHIWRTPSTTQERPYFYRSFLQLQFLETNLTSEAIDQIVISSVVPDLTPIIVEALTGLTNTKPVVVTAETYSEIKIEIDYPHELGSDLIANAVAAHSRYKDNCLVVDFGTALTFTTVTADARILGVAIVPGLKTAVKALFSNTAQLPEVPLSLPTSVIGKNTTHSIQAGILVGYEGLVKTIIARVKSELGGRCKVIATGGLSSVITGLVDEFEVIDKTLTLDGLRIIAEKLQ